VGVDVLRLRAMREMMKISNILRVTVDYCVGEEKPYRFSQAEILLARIEPISHPGFRQDVTRDRLLGFDFLAQMADAYP
jgi:hypothetical protein